MELNKKLFKEEEKDSTRAGFGRGLLKAYTKDVYVLTADLASSTSVSEFAKKYPKQFVQVGVAEQNLVTVASGLAHIGKVPFATTFAAFSPGRNWEQIRTTICYNNQPVKICSTHSGLGVGEDGATHQALEDVAAMRALPNMIVIQPCDALQAEKATLAIAKNKKPVYLRLHRQKSPTITTSKSTFKIGEAQVLKKGEHITIIGSGPVLYEVLKAAKELKEEGINAEVINVHTIKPLDEDTILKSVKKTDFVITVEDHQITGGLGSAVAELLSENYPMIMKRIGVNDVFAESGTNDSLYKKYGLTSDNIINEVKKLIDKY